MKQVININFHGRVVPIEVNAYDTLKAYIQSLHTYFATEEGKDEIVNDIENRIAELFQQKLDAGNTCITEADVEAVINSIGRTEDFDPVEGEQPQASAQREETKSEFEKLRRKKLFRDENDKILGGVCSGVANYLDVDTVIVRIIFAILFFSFGVGFLAYIILWVAVPSSAVLQIGSKRKKLFRDTENGYVAGVCSGIAQYFHINVWIPRLIFLIPSIGIIFRNRNNWSEWNDLHINFSPSLLIIYIILWLVVPKAVTTSDKLEMKGEKVDINSIKNTVKEELEGVQQRAKKFAKENNLTTLGAATTLGDPLRRGGSRLGEIIGLVAKIFVYFILGTLLISFTIALISLAVVSIGIFPLKDFVISGSNQNLLAWGTLIFFIAVPVIGIITWIIRRIMKAKAGSRFVAPVFSALWTIGWVCFIMLVVSLQKDFRKPNVPAAQEVLLTNPGVSRLEISTFSNEDKFRLPQTLNFTPFDWIDEDSAIARNITINIFQSTTDSFKVLMYKAARGATRDIANENAAKINFNIEQRDSLLLMDEGVSINKTDKFRNQEVILNVYVPVGKIIRIARQDNRWDNVRLNFSTRNNDDRSYKNAYYNWHTNTDYIMKADGLYTLDGKALNRQEDNEDYNETTVDDNGIKVRTKNGTLITVDDNGIEITDKKGNTEIISTSDSLREVKRKEKEATQRIKDSLKESIEKTKEQLKNLQNESSAMLLPRTILPGYNPVFFL